MEKSSVYQYCSYISADVSTISFNIGPYSTLYYTHELILDGEEISADDKQKFFQEKDSSRRDEFKGPIEKKNTHDAPIPASWCPEE